MLAGSVGPDGDLLKAICFIPMKLFTEEAMLSAIACWEWIVSLKPEFELQVILVRRFRCTYLYALALNGNFLLADYFALFCVVVVSAG